MKCVNLVCPLSHSRPTLPCILYSIQTFLKFHNFSSKVELTRLMTIYLLLLSTPFVHDFYSLKCHVEKRMEFLYLMQWKMVVEWFWLTWTLWSTLLCSKCVLGLFLCYNFKNATTLQHSFVSLSYWLFHVILNLLI